VQTTHISDDGKLADRDALSMTEIAVLHNQNEELTRTVTRQTDVIKRPESQLNIVMAYLDITEEIQPQETLKIELGHVLDRSETSTVPPLAQSKQHQADSTKQVLVAVHSKCGTLELRPENQLTTLEGTKLRPNNGFVYVQNG
jgi:hypothetical protein